MQLSAVVLSRAVALTGLFGLAHSSPTVSFPFNAQVPPVARIEQPFSFIFAANTFSSSSSAMNYSLSDPPSWLSIDSDARWLHGTPQESDASDGDVVGVSFGLVATDDAGSITLNSTLVVSRKAAPAVNISISQQLEDSGSPYSEPSSLLYYPDSPVNFTFSPYTFSPSGLNYYAVSGDNSPMPSWMAFDADTIRFSGTTPSSDSLVEPPQTFNFQLIASDVAGFSATAISFSVVVGSHEITVDDASIVLNASVGKTLTYDGLENGVKIDGKQASSKNLTATAQADLPDWLVFDNTTWEISGTPSSSAQSTEFVVSFSDILSDTVNVTVQIAIDQGTVFSSNLPNMQAQYGSQFSVDLKPYLLNTTGVEVTMQTQPQEDWITLDVQNLTVTGDVPVSGDTSTVSVSIQATLEGTDTTESQTFMLQITSGVAAANPSTATSATATASSSETATAAANKTSTKAILLAVLIPTALLGLAISFIAGCYCYRRRGRQQELANGAAADGGLNEEASVGVTIPHDGQSSDGTTLTHTPEKAYKVAIADIPAIRIQPVQTEAKTPPPEVDTASAAARNSNQTIDRESKLVGADIPEFPVPPGHRTPPRTVATVSDGGAAGQWPFEESTLLSSESKSSTRGGLRSGDSPDVQGYRDVLGISGDTLANGHGDNASVPPTEISVQRVSVGTPATLQESLVVFDGCGRCLLPEGRVESQEAIIDNGDVRSSMFVAAGSFNESRFSVQSNEDDQENAAAPALSRRILGGLAAKIAGRFRKPKPEVPPPAPPREPPSGPLQVPQPPPPPPPTSELVRSPVAPSEDSDYGSVTFGDVTMAQPFRPRPVFITSPNPSRVIAEEDEGLTPPRRLGDMSQPTSSRSSSHGSSGAALSVVARAREIQNWQRQETAGSIQERRQLGRHLGLRPVSPSTGYNELDADSASDEASDAIIRLDPPRPAFLGPVSPHSSDMDLSQEIARSISLRSQRPASTSSGFSGISAAMEEVRSLLLLPYDTPSPSPSPRGYSRDGCYSDGLHSPSSASWETLQSGEPNWTSVFDTVAASSRQTLYSHEAVSTPFAQSGLRSVVGAEQMSMRTGLDSAAEGRMPFYHHHPPQLHPEHTQRRPLVFPDSAYNYPVEESIAPEVEMCDADADAVPGAYPNSQDELLSDGYAESFIEAHLKSYSHSGSQPELRPRGSSIGLAVSKYSQSQLGSRNSLTSRASSGVLAFI